MKTVNCSPDKRNSGRIRRLHFTLIEVLTASCIIGISLGVLLAGFSTVLKTGENAGDYVTAGRLAEDKLNEMVLNPHALKEGRDQGRFPKPLGRFQWSTEVKKDDRGDDSNLYAVMVEILFTGGLGEKKTLVVNSMVPAPPSKNDDSSQQP